MDKYDFKISCSIAINIYLIPFSDYFFFVFNQSESKIIKLRRLAGQQISQLDRLAQNTG